MKLCLNAFFLYIFSHVPALDRIRSDVPVRVRAATVPPAAAPAAAAVAAAPAAPAEPLLLPRSAAPVPVHVWPAGTNHSAFQLPSYKRKKGDLCTQGPPIRVLALPLRGKDGTTIWHPARRDDSVDIQSPRDIQPGGVPYHMMPLSDPLDYFTEFCSDSALLKIVQHTNAKISSLQQVIGDANRGKATFF